MSKINLRDALSAAIGCLELQAMIYDARANDPRLATDKKANEINAADLRLKAEIFKAALNDPYCAGCERAESEGGES